LEIESVIRESGKKLGRRESDETQLRANEIMNGNVCVCACVCVCVNGCNKECDQKRAEEYKRRIPGS